MLLTISDFLRHTAFSMNKSPEDLIKIFEIFADFLKDSGNLKDSSTSVLEDGALKIPLKLDTSHAKKLESMLSEYPTVYKTGISNIPSSIGKDVVNFIYIFGQFLVVASLNLDGILVRLENANSKNKDKVEMPPVENVLNKFRTIWGKDPASARSLAILYNDMPKEYVIEDLLKKIGKSIAFLKGPLKTLYEKIKDIPG